MAGKVKNGVMPMDWGIVFWITTGAYAILSAIGLVLVSRASSAR